MLQFFSWLTERPSQFHNLNGLVGYISTAPQVVEDIYKSFGRELIRNLPEEFPLDLVADDKPEIIHLHLTLYSINTHFNPSTTGSFWNHCGKRRNCLKQAIFFFSHNVFYSFRKFYPYLSIFLTSYLYLLLK